MNAHHRNILTSLSRLVPQLVYVCLIFGAALTLSSCTERTTDVTPTSGGSCTGSAICQGELALYCSGTPQAYSVNCGDLEQRCERGVGCILCEPNAIICDGDEVKQCSADGRLLTSVMTCPDQCYRGECTTPCQREADAQSYQGCEYWPTPLSNSVSLGFSFAVGVVNVNGAPVTVTITRDGQTITERVIPPIELDVITLPWIDALTYESTSFQGRQVSNRVPKGAYKLVTTLPVIVYQFNPLEYQRDGNCPEEVDDNLSDGKCFSYSNDASLLLPAHAFGDEYLVLSYPSLTLQTVNGVSTNPSTFQVVATAPGETTVDVTFSAATAESLGGEFPQYNAGDRAQFTLTQGEVIQIAARPSDRCNNPSPATPDLSYCVVGAEGDLSGTLIESSQPIEVFGSHTCAFVPYNVFACDHLEESIFPLKSWGRDVVIPVIEPLINEPSIVRVISGVDNNRLSFSPSAVHPNVTLSRGESVTFEARESFIVNGTGRLQASQFLVGQNYSNADNQEGFGDPSMSLVPPSDQFRTSYKILAPESYALHYLNLVIPTGREVVLDGVPLPRGNLLEETSWEILTVEVEGGVHELTSASPFGVWVYGFGRYTSYMYPGGLDLKELADVQ